jgi:hypothetical protein
MYIGKLKASMNLGFLRSVNAVFVELRYNAAVGTQCAGKPVGFLFEGQPVQKHELHHT